MKRSITLTGLCQRGYRLALGDGQDWWITGDKDNIRLVDKLATIMELEACAFDGSPRLIFTKMENTDDARDLKERCYPSQYCLWGVCAGWVLYDHQTMRVWSHNSIPDVICEIGDNQTNDAKYLNMWISLQPIYQRSICYRGLPFHAALAELNGRGVLLAAPAGKGKSTCCRRLPDYWKPLCDDEALVVLDRQKEYRAHPFPTWSDYQWKRAENTWNVQHSVPLSGVFFLERSETDEAVPVGEGEAAVLMNESATMVCQKFWRRSNREEQRKFKRELFNNACEMAKKIPAFRLSISLHGWFWEEIEKALGS